MLPILLLAYCLLGNEGMQGFEVAYLISAPDADAIDTRLGWVRGPLTLGSGCPPPLHIPADIIEPGIRHQYFMHRPSQSPALRGIVSARQPAPKASVTGAAQDVLDWILADIGHEEVNCLAVDLAINFPARVPPTVGSLHSNPSLA
jgi:hypothetical protein